MGWRRIIRWDHNFAESEYDPLDKTTAVLTPLLFRQPPASADDFTSEPFSC